MPQITVVDQAGAERGVEAPLGRTLMEVIRDNGFDELLALCGGCCSCAGDAGAASGCGRCRVDGSRPGSR